MGRIRTNEADTATYYVVAGANWKGKYVLKSFTNESFSSEFVTAVVKEKENTSEVGKI